MQNVRQTSEYSLVTGKTRLQLEKKVNKLLKKQDGWWAQGQVTYIKGVYIQTMTKVYEPKLYENQIAGFTKVKKG